MLTDLNSTKIQNKRLQKLVFNCRFLTVKKFSILKTKDEEW